MITAAPLPTAASPTEDAYPIAPTPTPTPTLRIFLAEDHAIVREGLKTLINAQSQMQVVGEADDGRAAWERIRDLNQSPEGAANGGGPVDVAVMDVSMPVWNGAEATLHIKRNWPRTQILALSMHEDRSYLRSLLEAGASGYVLKRSAADTLINAIRVVANGGTYLDPALSATVVEGFVRNRASGGGANGASSLRGEIGGAPLSDRENEVLRLIAQGFTNKDIGVKLSVSVKTVETYKARSMEKLGLNSRVDLVRHALAQGWLSNIELNAG